MTPQLRDYIRTWVRMRRALYPLPARPGGRKYKALCATWQERTTAAWQALSDFDRTRLYAWRRGRPQWLVAEECRGPFYMGWWLYVRDRRDGSPNMNHWDHWGWLADHGNDARMEAGRRVIVAAAGPDVPPHRRSCDDLAEWFAKAYPRGLPVTVDGHGWPTGLRVIRTVPLPAAPAGG